MAFGAKIRLTVDKSKAAKFRQEIQQYVDSAVTESKPIYIHHIKVTKTATNALIKDLKTSLANANNVNLKINKIDATSAVNNLRSQLETMLSGLKITGLKEFLGNDSTDQIVKDIDKARKGATGWTAQMRVLNDITKKISSSYNSLLGENIITENPVTVQAITQEYSNWISKIETLKSVKAEMSQQDYINTQNEALAVQQKFAAIQQQISAEKQLATERARASKEEQINAQKELNLAVRQANLKGQVQNYILSHKKAYKAFKEQLDGMLLSLQSPTIMGSDLLKEIDIRFKSIKTSAKAAGLEGNTFFGTMQKGFQKFGGWSLITKSLTAVYHALTKVYVAIKDVDTAMTELRKVTDLSEASYKKYIKTAQELSKEIGATLADTINATADFARLGYGIPDASALAEAALVYKNVGDGIEDISEASNSLISTIKAFEQFGETADNAMSIIDRFNEVGNNFAISSKGVGDALLNSASALAAANNDLNESIALITAANSVIQDPEKVGTALKTISMYLRAAKTEAEEAGISTEGMAESVSSLRDEIKRLTGGKVDIMIDDENFKSTYQIVKDLSTVWEDLSDITRANILEQIGGKRNSNVVTSLISNFETAEDVMASMGAASGSALEENEKYLDSINGKLSKFQSSLEAFSNNFIDSDIIKFVIDVGTLLLDILNSLAELNVLLPAIGTGVAFVVKAMDTEKATNFARQIAEQSDLLKAQKSVLIGDGGLSDDEWNSRNEIVKDLTNSYSALSDNQKKLTTIELERTLTEKGLKSAEQDVIFSTMGMTKAAQAGTVANAGFSASFIKLAASIKLTWANMSLLSKASLIIGALSLIYSVGKDIIDNLETQEEILTRVNNEIKETSNNIKNLTNEYRNLKKSADEIIPRFAELAKGVSATGENRSLSAEEYDEFIDLSNQLADIFPEINMGMDSNGNAMLNMSLNADTLKDSLYELVEAERVAANQKIVNEELPKLIESATESQEIYNKQIAEYKNQIEELNDLKPNSTISVRGEDYSDTANAYRDFFKNSGIDYEVERVETRSGYIDYYKVLEQDEAEFEAAFSEYIARREKLISDSQGKINNVWKSTMPAFSAWMQSTSEFDIMGEELQNAVMGILGNLDFSALEDNEQNNIKGYIENNILDPIVTATPEIQRAVVELYQKTAQFESGSIGYGDYQSIANKVIGDLKALKVDDDVINALTLPISTEIDEENVALMAEKIKSILVGRGGVSVDDYVNSMRADEIKVAYSILPENGSITVEEFIGKLEEAKIEAMATTSAFVDVLDFSTMANSLEDVAGSVDKITSAMQKLRDGTAMTKAELAQLALEYPKLLEEENLFNAATIEGQNAVLENALETAEAEYDGKIEAKIAELEAFNELLQNQIDLEYEKEGILTAISDEAVSDKAANEAWLQEQINAFNANEAQNYVQIKNDELAANEELLAYKLSDESDAADGTEVLWADTTATLTNLYGQNVTVATKANSEYSSKTQEIIAGISNFIAKVQQGLRNLFETGEYSDIKGEGIADFGSIDVGKTTEEALKEASSQAGLSTKKYSDYLIDGKSITEWTDTQIKKAAERREILRKQIETNLTIIKNLENLKGLDLTSIYGSSGSGSSSSSNKIEEYIVDIEEYYAAIKRLEEAQDLVSDLEKELANTDDPAAKISIYDKLADAYREQAAAEENLSNERKKTVSANVEALRQLGFEVEYNAETNDLYIKNLEHVNELEADSKGEHKSLQEATNELRKDVEELINTTEDLNDANRDSADTVEDIVYEIQNAAKEIIACVEEIYEAQIEKYNAIIEKRKESIESIKDELSYEEDLAGKIKEIADLQARIDQLSLDDSREAQAERSTLLAELAELQKELSNTQSEHSFEEQTEALDKLAEEYEAERLSEIELMKESIGTVQELGTEIDERIVNAWENAKKAVEQYGIAVSNLGLDTVAVSGVVPKYHTGGVVGSDSKKEEVLALLESGEVVLNDGHQQAVYEMIDFTAELSKRLGVAIGNFTPPDMSTSTQTMFGDLARSLAPVNQNNVFEPHIAITIQHSGNMSDVDARRFGEQIADVTISKMNEAFERKGIVNTRSSRLRQ